jgi:hypothetical protein
LGQRLHLSLGQYEGDCANAQYQQIKRGKIGFAD